MFLSDCLIRAMSFTKYCSCKIEVSMFLPYLPGKERKKREECRRGSRVYFGTAALSLLLLSFPLMPLVFLGGQTLSVREDSEQTYEESGTALASPGIERDFRSERETILWSEFRDKVKAVLPDYTQQELTQELAELNVEAQYVGGDVNLSGVASYSLTSDPNNAAGTLSTHIVRLAPQVSKKFLKTGTTVTVGLANTLGISSVEGGSLTNTSTIAPTVTVTQDLLQNFFGLLDRLNFADAGRKLEIAKEQRLYNEQKLQQSYDWLYSDWILLWRTQKVLIEQLRKSGASLRNAQTQRKLNYIDNGSYQQIYNSHLVYRQTLLNNEERLLTMDQQFARFLGQGLFKPDLTVLDLLLEESLGDFDELHFENSRTWAISEKSLNRSNILYKFSKLNRLPTLTLKGSFGLETSATYGDSEQPSYSELKPTYSLEVSLSWPVLMRKAGNSEKVSLVQLKQLESTLNKQRQDFEISIAKQRAAHEFLIENYDIRKETAKAKTAIYVSNQVKYRQARAGIRNLLDAEIQKLAAELNLLETESKLVRQLLDYRYETRDGDFLSQ
ncbi:TolC family protein [Candidatus Haliotispira prima]|uniref:TolC family protein n=1 Tax=Candidatus Haliotispira prima TaxID=3034016 RepID=A0ABY8MIB6_9SPIO|nr:TolC family protein [Candidatus Haliotispira prima]